MRYRSPSCSAGVISRRRPDGRASVAEPTSEHRFASFDGVEIAYMTFPAFEGRGHATATIAALVEIAAGAGARPIALTLPEENASNRALRRNGFVFAGETPRMDSSGAGSVARHDPAG